MSFDQSPPAAEHTLTAADGWRLNVLDLRPEQAARATAVVGHAMLVDRRTVYRPGGPSLAGTLVSQGCRVLVPDLRGHGASGPRAESGGRWDYDDLVADVGQLIDLARQLEPGRPLVLVGHSLFAHNALAYLGRRPGTQVAALVMLAAGLWQPNWEPGRLRWMAKWALIESVWALALVAGRVPARSVGAGTCDESLEYWRDFRRFATSGRWLARDGFDYHAGLERITCPVLHVVSCGDHLSAPPEALRFSARLGPRRQIWELGGASGPPPLRRMRKPPGHMELVTRADSEPVWDAVGTWIHHTAVDTSARSESERPPIFRARRG